MGLFVYVWKFLPIAGPAGTRSAKNYSAAEELFLLSEQPDRAPDGRGGEAGGAEAPRNPRTAGKGGLIIINEVQCRLPGLYYLLQRVRIFSGNS